MKRLRLIKPWRLRIQPQRLAHTGVEFFFAAAVPCAGPQAIDDDACSLRGFEAGSFNARFSGAATQRLAAPRSIFAPVTNERFRS